MSAGRGTTPERGDLPPAIPRRDASGHKGTFGTVGVIGGCAASTRMIGAPALVALTALRAGAGLVRVVCPDPILDSVLTLTPSATGIAMPVEAGGWPIAHEGVAIIDELAREADCLAIGPGLGRSASIAPIALRAIQQEDAPVVIDADAINALATLPEVWREVRAAAVFTPHPGEFRRLATALGSSEAFGMDTSRERAAEHAAQRLGAIVVLKGAHSVVTDGQRTWTHDAPANPVLATGGTGDVLTGVIAGLIAQHVRLLEPGIPPGIAARMRPPTKQLELFDAVRLGVIAHAEAARLWREARGATGGMLAMELADRVAVAVEALRD